MNITGYDQQSKLLEWAERLAASIEPDDVDTAQSIRAAIDQYRKHRFLLAVLGKAKRGKSTLVNAFLGRADDLVAPIDRLPASSTITKFSWARQEAACVRFRDRSEAITFDKIRDYVIEDRNPGNVKGVTLVEVSGPFAHLDPDLDLVDTPGAGSIHEHHDVLLHGFLPQADATLFLVTASMPLDQDELELLKRIKKADIRKLFFAINKVDNASEDEIDAAIIHNRSLLAGCGIQVGTIHRISARRAFAGDLANSGLLGLVAELNSFLTTEKGRVFSERFVARVHEAAQSVLDGFTIEAAASRKTRSELDAELERLQTERRGLESELRSCEEIFLSDWNRAIDEFERNLLSARSVVAREVNDRIEAVTVLGVNALAQELPTLIARSTERSLHESAERLEKALAASAEQLQARYPVVDVMSLNDSDGLKVRLGRDFTVGAVKGTLFAAAGLAVQHVVASAAITMGSIPMVGGLAAATTALVGGPVALLPIAIGAYVAANGWRLSREKLRDKLYLPAKEQIHQLFDMLRLERVPDLRQQGLAIVKERRSRLDHQIHVVETALARVRMTSSASTDAGQLERRIADLRNTLNQHPNHLGE